MSKPFKTYEEQMKYLQEEKNIIVTEADKILLVRNGYFNIINGYKEPFVTGKTADGKHVYLKGTTVLSLVHVKNFDEELRAHLFKYLTKVEQEIRQTFAYQFDAVNSLNDLTWEDKNAYNLEQEQYIELNIEELRQEIADSNHGYLVHYKEKHEQVPIWVALKYTKFSRLINIIKIASPEVKAAFCNLYNIEIKPREQDFNKIYDFKVLDSSLQWIRLIRNACAHNERVYGMKRSRRTMTKYHRELGLNFRDEQKIIDLIIFMKYYLSPEEYEEFVFGIYANLKKLKSTIDEVPYNRIRNLMGVSREEYLLELLKKPNEKKYSEY